MAQQQTLWQCPDPSDTTDLHFKLVCKLKVFDPQEKPFDSYTSLVAAAQKFGLVFVGTANGFLVIKTNILNSSTSTIEYPRKEILIGSRPSHISVDFNQDLLAVGCSTSQGCVAHIYKISNLSQAKAAPLKSISLSRNPDNNIRDLIWQPNSPNTFTCCFTDGSVLSLTLNPNGCQEFTLPSSTQSTCLCWSPKGKQIVIGSENGTLSQYKPDLKLVKTLPAPNLFANGVSAVNILWISNYQFAVSYKEKNNENAFPIVVIVNAVKNEPVGFINYEDVTYAGSFFRVHQIYLLLQQAWNLLIVSSSNSMEVAVLHTKEDNATWEQWLLGDASRAELPLNANHQETFPIGLALDYSATENIPWGDNFIPPMPRLLLLSHEGILCVFNLINLLPNVPEVCGRAIEAFDDSLFTTQPTPVEAPKPTAAPPQSTSSFFGTAKPSSTFSFTPLSSVTTQSQTQSAFGTAAPALSFTSGQTPQTQSIFAPTGNQQLSFGPQSGLGLQSTFNQTPTKSLFGTPPATVQSSLASTPPQTMMGHNLTQQTPPQQSYLQSSPQQSQQSPLQVSAFPQNQKTTFSQPTGTVFATANKASPLSQTYNNQTTKMADVKPVEAILTVKPTAQGLGFSQESAEIKVAPTKPQEQDLKIDKKAVAPSPVPTSVSHTPEPPAIDDSIYINAIMDEIDHFNSELQHLSSRIANFQTQVGTDDEKLLLRKKVENLYEFWKELKETTISQNTEVHSVKADLMESFAWLEDAKSRNAQRKNPTYVQLKRSEELDPISSRHMTDISHLKYYIENQLKQLNDYLDKEWMEHQDNCRKDVKNKMIIPSMEEVYKTMHLQLKILNKQRIQIEDIKRRLSEKSLKTSSQISVIKNTENPYSENLGNSRVSELSKLAENLLQLKISREEHSPLNAEESWKLVARAQVNAIAQRSRKLTTEKQAILRDAFTERDMIRTRPVKSTFETSTFIRNVTSGLKEKPEKKIASKIQQQVTSPVGKEKTEKPQSTIVDNTFFKSVKNTSTPIKTPQVVPPSLEAMGDAPKTFEKLANMPSEPVKKPESAKSIFSFEVGTQTKGKPNVEEEKCPLSSLSGIVSSIGNETAPAKPTATGNAFSFTTQKPTENQKPFSFGMTPKGPEKTEPAKTETFSFTSLTASKTAESFNFAVKNDAKTTASAFPPPQNFPLGLTTTKAAAAATSMAKTTTALADTTSSVRTTTPIVASADTTGNMVKAPSFSFTSPTPPATTTPTSFFQKSKFTLNEQTGSIFGTPPSATTLAATATVSAAATTTTSVFGSLNFGAATTIFSTPTGTKPKSTVEQKASTPPAAALSPKETKPTTPTVSTVTATNNALFTPKSSSTPAPQPETPKADSEKEANPTPPSTPTTTMSFSAFQAKSDTATAPSALFSQPLFSTATPSVSTPSLFGGTPASTSAPFSQIQTTPSIFGQPTSTSSIFSTPTTSTNLFAAAAASAPATTASGSIFGTPVSSATTTTGTGSIFGTPIASTATTASSSIFGTPVASAATTTGTGSIFGTPTASATTTTGTGSIFGTPTASATATTASGSIFGTPVSATTTAPTGSIFGTPTTTTTASLFGSPTTTTQSIFGQISTPTTSASSFGQKTDVNQTAGLFGQLLSGSLSSNVFNNTPTTSSTNIFSQNTFGQQTNSNIFGGAPATTSSSSLFGTTSSTFGSQSGSIFGQASATTAGSVFGQPTATTSSSFFGQNVCSPFGGGSTTTVAPNQNPFAASGASTFGSKPVFGQNLFGQTQNTSLFIHASTSSSVFGGSTAPASGNLFQTPTTNSFGAAGSSPPGPFSGGQSSVAQAGFGAPASFQKSLGGFGGTPVFGGSTAPAPAIAFGSPPSFGSPPTFGSQSAFGSPQKVFGSPTGGTFGQTTGQSTTFENLANQPTVGFGNLAQQNPAPTFGNSSFGSPPSFGGGNSSFGGNSFSSWRQ